MHHMLCCAGVVTSESHRASSPSMNQSWRAAALNAVQQGVRVDPECERNKTLAGYTGISQPRRTADFRTLSKATEHSRMVIPVPLALC